jgi:hypothetical protein
MTRRMTKAEEYELAQLGVGPYDPEAEPPEPSDLELLEQWFTEEQPPSRYCRHDPRQVVWHISP